MWEGNLVAGRSVRATARLTQRPRRELRRDLRRAAGPVLRHRHADPLVRRPRPAGARETRWASTADMPVLFVFGGSQAVRRLNRAVADALPTLVENA